MKSSDPWDDKWKLGDLCGKGGQGLTYHVTSKSDAALHGVLKKLKNNRDIQQRRRMRMEVTSLDVLAQTDALVARVLSHNTNEFKDPNVQLYLVTEYISGRTLHELVTTDGPLVPEKAVRVLTVLANTVAIAHQNRIGHRDIKPDNIIVRDLDSADVVVVDYGLSFNLDYDSESITQPNETFRNKFLDLPENNAPGGNRQDFRSDITCLSGILYFCLTGNRPGHLLDSQERPPHLRLGYSVREKLSDDWRIQRLETFFNRGFAQNVENRFQSVDEFLQRLTDAMDGPEVVEDPIERGNQISDVLRKQDRTTQLSELQLVAGKAVAKITNYVQQLPYPIGTFNVSIAIIDDTERGNFPPSGIDKVDGIHIGIDVHVVSDQTRSRMIEYRFGSRGIQCVLLRRIRSGYSLGSGYVAGYPVKASESAVPWVEAVWFDQQSVDSTAFVEDAKSAISNAMRQIQDEILSPQPTIRTT